MLDRHLTGPAVDVYRDAQKLEDGGFPPEQALAMSVAAERTPGRASADVPNSAFTRFDNSRLAGTYNGQTARQEVRDIANYYTAQFHMPPEQAVEAATAAVEKHYTRINGYAVNTRNIAVPDNFGDAADRMIQKWAAENGEDPDDLTLAPDGTKSNRWIISEVVGNHTIRHPMWATGQFSTQQIVDYGDEQRLAEAEQRRADRAVLQRPIREMDHFPTSADTPSGSLHDRLADERRRRGIRPLSD